MFHRLILPLHLLRIAWVLARHDALAPAENLGVAPTTLRLLRRLGRRAAPGRPGQKLARALVELGPSFIKFGQFLATRADLLGDEAAADLAELQDRLPPFAIDEARQVVEDELGQPVEKLFSRFDDTPVSAASIAQVHFAVTRESDAQAEPREVAVKILRPGIEAAFARDLELFYWLARLVERAQPQFRRLRPVAVIGVFEQTVRLEMDLRMEAAAASELADNFEGDDSYHVPKVDWERTARRVLTQSRLEGIRLDDRTALLAQGHDITEVLTKAATIFFKQVFRDGFFHGDQHPGNMFVMEDGAIAAVDFGIMGRLDKRTRRFLADMLIATLARDYRRLAEVHVEAGYLSAGQPLEVFAQALRAVCEPIFGRPLERISFARLLGQLLRLSESFQLQVQPELVLLQKNMLMAEGVSRRLDPSLNIWVLAEPLIVDWMRTNRGAPARLRDTGQQLALAVERLPAALENAERALEQVADGGLRLHPETLHAFSGGRQQARNGRYTFLLAVAALTAALLALLR